MFVIFQNNVALFLSFYKFTAGANFQQITFQKIFAYYKLLA